MLQTIAISTAVVKGLLALWKPWKELTIAGNMGWSDDPFIESVIPSAWDPVAPPGKHWMSNFIQYCPPQLADGPWT